MSPVRIDTTNKISTVNARVVSARGGSGAPFILDEASHATSSARTAPTTSVASLDTLLALQGAQLVEDPVERRKRALRRGRSMLDVLEAMRGDLLVGRLGTDRLVQLMAIIGQARDQSEPGLDRLLDDIELRARVELAKHGVFPG
jgi:hypothetical protein